MNSVIVYNIVRIAISFYSSGLFDRIATLVRGLISANMAGADKKKAIEAYLTENKLDISGILLDGIIFATRLRYEFKT